MQNSPAIAMTGCRYRRGSENPRRSDREWLWRGTNGAGFDDFRGGYGRCMAWTRCGCRGEDYYKREKAPGRMESLVFSGGGVEGT